METSDDSLVVIPETSALLENILPVEFSLYVQFAREMEEIGNTESSIQWNKDNTLKLLELMEADVNNGRPFQWDQISVNVGVSILDCKGRFDTVAAEFKAREIKAPVIDTTNGNIVESIEMMETENCPVTVDTDVIENLKTETCQIAPTSPVKPFRILLEPSSPSFPNAEPSLPLLNADPSIPAEPLIPSFPNAIAVGTENEDASVDVAVQQELVVNSENQLNNESIASIETTVPVVATDISNIETNKLSDTENLCTNAETIVKAETVEIAKEIVVNTEANEKPAVEVSKIPKIPKIPKREAITPLVTETPRMTERQQLAFLLGHADAPTPVVKKKEKEEKKEEIKEKKEEKRGRPKLETNILQETPKVGRPPGTKKQDSVNIWLPEDFETWPSDRQKAWKKIPQNPDNYYFKFCPPGVALKSSSWSTKEKKEFIEMLKIRPAEDKWGLFSMNFPGRTGEQCKQFYQLLEKSNELSEVQAYEDQLYGEEIKKSKRKKSSTSDTESEIEEIKKPKKKKLVVSETESETEEVKKLKRKSHEVEKMDIEVLPELNPPVPPSVPPVITVPQGSPVSSASIGTPAVGTAVKFAKIPKKTTIEKKTPSASSPTFSVAPTHTRSASLDSIESSLKKRKEPPLPTIKEVEKVKKVKTPAAINDETESDEEPVKVKEVTVPERKRKLSKWEEPIEEPLRKIDVGLLNKFRYQRNDITSPQALKARCLLLCPKRPDSIDAPGINLPNGKESFQFVENTLVEQRAALHARFITEQEKLFDQFSVEMSHLQDRVHYGGSTKFQSIMSLSLSRYHQLKWKRNKVSFSNEKIRSMVQHIIDDFDKAKTELLSRQHHEALGLQASQLACQSFEKKYPENLFRDDFILPPLVTVSSMKDLSIPQDFLLYM